MLYNENDLDRYQPTEIDVNKTITRRTIQELQQPWNSTAFLQFIDSPGNDKLDMLEMGKNKITSMYTYDKLWNLSGGMGRADFIEKIVPFSIGEFITHLKMIKSDEEREELVNRLASLPFDHNNEVYASINNRISSDLGFPLPNDYLKYLIINKYVEDTLHLQKFNYGVVSNYLFAPLIHTLAHPTDTLTNGIIPGMLGVKGASFLLGNLVSGVIGSNAAFAGGMSLHDSINGHFYENPFRKALGLPELPKGNVLTGILDGALFGTMLKFGEMTYRGVRGIRSTRIKNTFTAFGDKFETFKSKLPLDKINKVRTSITTFLAKGADLVGLQRLREGFSNLGTILSSFRDSPFIESLVNKFNYFENLAKNITGSNFTQSVKDALFDIRENLTSLISSITGKSVKENITSFHDILNSGANKIYTEAVTKTSMLWRYYDNLLKSVAMKIPEEWEGLSQREYRIKLFKLFQIERLKNIRDHAKKMFDKIANRENFKFRRKGYYNMSNNGNNHEPL